MLNHQRDTIGYCYDKDSSEDKRIRKNGINPSHQCISPSGKIEDPFTVDQRRYSTLIFDFKSSEFAFDWGFGLDPRTPANANSIGHDVLQHTHRLSPHQWPSTRNCRTHCRSCGRNVKWKDRRAAPHTCSAVSRSFHVRAQQKVVEAIQVVVTGHASDRARALGRLLEPIHGLSAASICSSDNALWTHQHLRPTKYSSRRIIFEIKKQ